MPDEGAYSRLDHHKNQNYDEPLSPSHLLKPSFDAQEHNHTDNIFDCKIETPIFKWRSVSLQLHEDSEFLTMNNAGSTSPRLHHHHLN